MSMLFCAWSALPGQFGGGPSQYTCSFSRREIRNIDNFIVQLMINNITQLERRIQIIHKIALGGFPSFLISFLFFFLIM